MTDNSIQTAASPGEFRASWPLVVTCFLMLMLVSGLPLYSMPFIYREVVADTGWTREQVTLIASFKFLTGAAVAILFGSLIDAIGDRPGILLAAIVHSVAVACFFFADTLWAFYAVGIGMGASGPAIMAGVKTIISRNFHTHQGTAFGLALAGTSAAGVVAPITVQFLLAHFDWRMTMVLLTASAWLIAMPLFVIMTRKLPTSRGLPAALAHADEPKTTRLAMLAQMSGEPRFWLLALGVLLVGAVDQGISQHQVFFLQDDRGINPSMVAIIASAYAVVGVISKIGFGAIYDRLSLTGVAIAYLILFVDPLLALTVVGPVTAAIFVLTRGVAHGALIVDVPIVTKHVYGTRHLGLRIGILTTFLQLGFALGPWVMGRVHELTGAYDYGFFIFSGFALTAALMVSRVKPVFWLAMKGKAGGAALEAAQGVSSGAGAAGR